MIAASGSKASVQSASSKLSGRAYAAFAADIDKGTQTVPAFAEAVRRHEVIAAIERSATRAWLTAPSRHDERIVSA